jgi:hypothetical protein
MKKMKARLKQRIKPLVKEGDKVNYLNPINGMVYRNAIILKVIKANKKLPKKYWSAVGHHPTYNPYKRPYASAVVKTENGKICFPRVNIIDMM